MECPLGNRPSTILPNNRRVSVNLKQHSAHPQNETAPQSTDQPTRKNRRDVILMTKKHYLFENRWKWSDDVVDYDTVQFWDCRPFDLDLHELKRIKIYGLQYEIPPNVQANLLRLLSSRTALWMLEMDCLELLKNSKINLTFKSLRLLSINAIRIVTDDGLEALGESALVRLDAPNLRIVFLGQNFLGLNSIDFTEFVNCKVLSLLNEGVPRHWDLRQTSFLGLQVLVCNRYRPAQFAIICEIACGKLLPDLTVLCLTYDVLECTSYQLTAVECVHVRELYEAFSVRRGQLKSGLCIYMQGLRFDANRLFVDCGFHLKLIEFHFNNVRDGFEVQSCYTTWCADYLHLLDTFWSIESGLLHFYGIYPNLRVFTVNNETGRRIGALALQLFLQSYAPLTELELRFCNFDSNTYGQLMRVSNLDTLHSLVVLEQPGEYTHRVSFEFLQNRFKLLRKFHTNLATLPTMLKLFEAMQVGANFWFDFTVRGNTFRRCSVFRRRATFYELRAEIRHSQKPGVREVHRETFESLYDLADHLTRPNPDFSLRHWLDAI